MSPGVDVSEDVAALQAVLAGEHAAVYAYGVIGARASKPDGVLAHRSYDIHQARRDQLTTMLARLGERPVEAEPGYALPFPVDDRRSWRRLARLVEHRCAALYAAAVADTGGRTRELMAEALTDCAVRGQHWGDPGEPFPGLSTGETGPA